MGYGLPVAWRDDVIVDLKPFSRDVDYIALAMTLRGLRMQYFSHAFHRIVLLVREQGRKSSGLCILGTHDGPVETRPNHSEEEQEIRGEDPLAGKST